MIKLICFDLDGVLLTSTDWHYRALNKSLGIFGKSIAEDAHINVFNGLPTKKKLEMMTSMGTLPKNLHDIIGEKKKQYTKLEIEQSCHPEYDKRIMLLNLKKKGYKLACCSNATKESVYSMLTYAGIAEYFDEFIGNDEGFSPKPSPDIYLEAFKRFQVDPEEAIIIEDAEHGYQAALASGGRVIRVKDPSEVNTQLFIKYNLL